MNDPIYFHTFAERATRHGLRYLGETRISTMVTGNFGADVRKTLAALATDQIQTEQYLDFVRNRTFRETLLVRAEQTPNWGITPERIYGLNVAVGAKVVGKPVDLTTEAATCLAVPEPQRHGCVSATNPLFKAAMLALTEAWPERCRSWKRHLHRAVAKLNREATGTDLDVALATGLLNAHVRVRT